jgi:hypothetical protein
MSSLAFPYLMLKVLAAISVISVCLKHTCGYVYTEWETLRSRSLHLMLKVESGSCLMMTQQSTSLSNYEESHGCLKHSLQPLFQYTKIERFFIRPVGCVRLHKNQKTHYIVHLKKLRI